MNTESLNSIRKATNDDVTVMADWLAKLLAHVKATTDDPYLSNVTLSTNNEVRALMRTWVNDGNGLVYVYALSGVGKGFIKAKIARPFVASSPIKQVGLIEMLWVEPDVRRQGAAQSLVQSAEGWFKQKGIDYIDLHYMMGNEIAEQFWEKQGYSPYHVRSYKKL